MRLLHPARVAWIPALWLALFVLLCLLIPSLAASDERAAGAGGLSAPGSQGAPQSHNIKGGGSANGGAAAGSSVRVSVQVTSAIAVYQDGTVRGNGPVIRIGSPEEGLVTYVMLDG